MPQEQQANSFSGVLGRALLLPLRAVAYVLNPLNCCNSSDKVKRDMRIALKEVGDGCPRIALHAEMLRDSAELGMRFLKDKSDKFQSGYVTFSIPERLAGKMHKVKQKKIDALQKEYPNIQVDQRNKKMILIEIDTPGIQKDIDPKKYKFLFAKKLGRKFIQL